MTDYFSPLHKDVKRYLILNFLDGPSACALMSTCKAFTPEVLKLKPHQVMALRLRDMDKEAQCRVLREKIEICTHCFATYLPPQKHKCDLPETGKCRACSAVGPKYKLFPWLNTGQEEDPDDLMVRLQRLKDDKKKKKHPSKIRDVTIHCFTCLKTIDVKNWIGINLQCTECGVRCDLCEGYLKICEYCDTPILRDSFDYHQQNECKGNSWLRWGLAKLPDKPKYACSVGNCEEKFKTHRGFIYHMLDCHYVDERELGKWWLLWQDKPKTIECFLCTKTFVSFEDRARHIKMIHRGYQRVHYRLPFRRGETGRNLRCDICGNEVALLQLYDHPKLCMAFSRRFPRYTKFPNY